MSDPWADEWASMSYTERLNWWWAARRAYQSQEDFAAGKPAAEGVSCKYGIPGFLPGTRTPYIKVTSAPVEEAKVDSATESVAAAPEESKPNATEENKPSVETTPSEGSTPATPAEDTKSTSSEEEKKSGTVNLIIPPGNSSLNVSNKKKKNKNKGKH